MSDRNAHLFEVERTQRTDSSNTDSPSYTPPRTPSRGGDLRTGKHDIPTRRQTAREG